MKILLATIASIFSVIANAQPVPEPAFTNGIKFTDSVPCNKVQDQGMSPTCWTFGSNSIFESDLLRQKKVNTNLSEMFFARYAYIDKINAYLLSKGKTYHEGGGQFHDIIRVIEKHGIIPEDAYPGLPFGQVSHNHADLDSSIKKMSARFLKSGSTQLSTQQLKSINDTLDKYLGIVPASFVYQGKRYTPRSFADDYLQFKNDYLELVSFANKPKYEEFVLEDKYNWARDKFFNLSLDDMKEVVDTALAKSWSVAWEGDVTEAGFRYAAGFAAIGDSAHAYDQERILNYANESTERDHMLQIVGATTDENNRRWYYMKNSWGNYYSKYKGYMFMEENYFRLKTVILIVNKQALPDRLRKKINR